MIIIHTSFREMTRLSEIESQAKTAGKGKWNKEKNPNVCYSTSCVLTCLYVCVCILFKAVRNITWNVENLRNFVDKNQGKEFDGEWYEVVSYHGSYVF